MKSLYLTPILLAAGLVSIGYDSFLSYDDITLKITTLLNNTSTQFVSHIQISKIDNSNVKTIENRSITLLKVTDPASSIPENLKGKVLVTAQHHAVGMTGAAMACYILESLLDRTDVTMVDLLNSKVIYVIPVVNPDSYVKLDKTAPYAASYMKNRNPGSVICTPPNDLGVNLDNNYDSSFLAVTDPCSVNYCGQEAFSEIETKYVRDVVAGNSIDVVIDYDLSGSAYLFPPAGNPFSLKLDYAGFADSFIKSSEFSQTYASRSTYSQIDGVQTNGTLIDWAYTNKGAFSLQARIGSKDVTGSGLITVLQYGIGRSNIGAFTYLAKRTRSYYT